MGVLEPATAQTQTDTHSPNHTRSGAVDLLPIFVYLWN